METKKVNIPKKGAGRKLAKKLEDLGKQKPPKEWIDAINQKDRKDRKENDIAASSLPPPDREMEM